MAPPAPAANAVAIREPFIHPLFRSQSALLGTIPPLPLNPSLGIGLRLDGPAQTSFLVRFGPSTPIGVQRCLTAKVSVLARQTSSQRRNRLSLKGREAQRLLFPRVNESRSMTGRSGSARDEPNPQEGPNG